MALQPFIVVYYMFQERGKKNELVVCLSHLLSSIQTLHVTPGCSLHVSAFHALSHFIHLCFLVAFPRVTGL